MVDKMKQKQSGAQGNFPGGLVDHGMKYSLQGLIIQGGNPHLEFNVAKGDQRRSWSGNSMLALLTMAAVQCAVCAWHMGYLLCLLAGSKPSTPSPPLASILAFPPGFP